MAGGTPAAVTGRDTVRIPTALVGARVERTAFDHQVRLVLRRTDPASAAGAVDGAGAVDAELVVETPFLFRSPAGGWLGLVPGSGVSLAPVLGLFERSITSVEVGDRGTLTLGFTDGAGLRVPPDPRFESWHLTGRGVAPVTVGPGGEEGWEP